MRHGLDFATNHFDRSTAVGGLSVLPDKTVYSLLTGIVRCEHVDYAHVIQLTSRIHVAARDQFLRDAPSDLAREEAVRSHPREEIEQNLRETHTRGFFCN